MIIPRVLFFGDPAMATPWVGLAKKLARSCYENRIANNRYHPASGVTIQVQNIFPASEKLDGVSKVWIKAGEPGIDGFLLHLYSSDSPYGFVRDIEGNVIEKPEPYYIGESELVMSGGFVLGYSRICANSVLIYDEKTGKILKVTRNVDKIAGNNVAYYNVYNADTGTYKKTRDIVSWWHSASGDGPIHEYASNTPFYPSTAIPTYIPYVDDPDSTYYVDSTHYYKIRLRYRTPDNAEYIIFPQLYINGILVYIHGDMSDPQGFFAGVHVVSPTRILAVYVSGRNNMGTAPYASSILRYDTAELLDINLTSKTVATVGTLAQNKFYATGRVRMTWPFRFSIDGTKVSNLQKMGNLYTTLKASPVANNLTYADGDNVYRDARFLVNNNIIRNESTDTYSINSGTNSAYVLDSVNSIVNTITTTYWEREYGLYEGDSTEVYAVSGSLYGSFQIPYAINYIDNTLTISYIKFSNAAYNYSFTYLENHRRLTSSFYEKDWFSIADKKRLTVLPTLLHDGSEYELYYPTTGYTELSTTTKSSGECLDAPGAGYYQNATYGGEIISPPKLHISYIDVKNNILILTGHSISPLVYYWAYGSVSDTGLYKTNGIGSALKLDYCSVNGGVALSNNGGILNLPVDILESIKYSDYSAWYNSNNFNPFLDAAFSYAFRSFDNARASDTENLSTHRNIQIIDLVGNSIFAAVKVAIDCRLPSPGYIYKTDWPETDIVTDYGPPEVSEHFGQVQHSGSNLSGYNPSLVFDIIGLA